VIVEKAEPTARRDLEEFFDHLVSENSDYFRHSFESSDDIPSHIRIVLTRTSEKVLISMGKCSSEPGRAFSYSRTGMHRIDENFF